jgi:hypothetical protein
VPRENRERATDQLPVVASPLIEKQSSGAEVDAMGERLGMSPGYAGTALLLLARSDSLEIGEQEVCGHARVETAFVLAGASGPRRRGWSEACLGFDLAGVHGRGEGLVVAFVLVGVRL